MSNKTFTVYATQTKYMKLEVKAESPEHAMKIADKSSGNDWVFIEYGGWSIDDVEESNKRSMLDC